MRKMLVFLAVFVIFAGITNAGDVARKGTTGADQLLIPVGARSIATGGAFLSNTVGVEAIYYNPAGLDVSKRSEAMFSYMSYIADINVSYFAVGANLGELGSIGFSYKTFDMGNIPVTTNLAPDGNGATYSPGFYTAGITYSKIITDRVAVGVNAKLIHEGIMNAFANGFAIDFGVQYRFPKNLTLGVAIKNVGTNMSYSGQDLEVRTEVPGSNPNSANGAYTAVTEEFQLPSYFELSLAYESAIDERNNFLVGGTFRNNNAAEDELAFGLEYSFMKTLYLRGGYNMLMEHTSESIFGLTCGAGVNYSLMDDVNIVFDYAFRTVKDFPNPNHIFTLKLIL
jgi:opacity protein-like surface antigen